MTAQAVYDDFRAGAPAATELTAYPHGTVGELRSGDGSVQEVRVLAPDADPRELIDLPRDLGSVTGTASAASPSRPPGPTRPTASRPAHPRRTRC